ncbi:hypothetical protein ALI22I_35760 [Saccharothrix sp. ALI-22-I]|uniref:hypothetical protein n=1 Tax=Saccharothrix sp. ALI-22-I TaxID=1933778 RepID=UPI00097BC455|nr:hypothetical protein [Saccharothrix sp. ALI-22-I]ONI83804.1 hypothetical protein ALI22I_35760 [Saccharothrix sp. ALI-22-I]
MTRWLFLYARARQIPVSAAVVVAGVAALAALAPPDGSPQLAAFAAAIGVAALATGLGGHDLALDRTAAFGWPPRRAAHLLVGGTVTAALLLAVDTFADPIAPDALVLRDVAGLGGLAALGALLFGSRAAWTLPIGWAGVTLVIPPGHDHWLSRLLSWPVQPADTTSATITAVVLGCTGLLAYSLFGCRR